MSEMRGMRLEKTVKCWMAATLLACGLCHAAAQSAPIPPVILDPALLTKADAGDPAAQVAVGELYAAAPGRSQDLKKAAEWYLRAAAKGDLAAELHLAALNRDGGRNFPRDMEQAVAWYRKAAEQGDIIAQGTLGVLYSLGQGVTQNYVEAYFWLDVAARAKSAKQEQFAANRQMVGQHITTEELEAVQDRVEGWLAAHPRPAAAQ